MSRSTYDPLNTCYLDNTKENRLLVESLGYEHNKPGAEDDSDNQIMVLLNINKYLITFKVQSDTHIDGELFTAIHSMTSEERALFKSATGLVG